MAATTEGDGAGDVTFGGLEGGTPGGRAVSWTIPLGSPARKTASCLGVESALLGLHPTAQMPQALHLGCCGVLQHVPLQSLTELKQNHLFVALQNSN